MIIHWNIGAGYKLESSRAYYKLERRTKKLGSWSSDGEPAARSCVSWNLTFL